MNPHKQKLQLYSSKVDYEPLPWDIRIKTIGGSYDFSKYGQELYTVILHAPYKLNIPINSQHMHDPNFEYAIHKEIHQQLEILWEDLTAKAGRPLDVFGNPAPQVPAPLNIAQFAFGDEYGHTPTSVNLVDMNENQLRQYWEMQLKGFKAKHKIAGDSWQTIDGNFGYTPFHQDVGTIVQNNLHKLIPGLRATVKCPACAEIHKDSLSKMIIHLNDTYKWSRNKVADWIESLDVDTTVKELE